MNVKDSVQLKSGGPVMEVDSIHEDEVICVWHNDVGEFQIDSFVRDTLILVPTLDEHAKEGQAEEAGPQDCDEQKTPGNSDVSDVTFSDVQGSTENLNSTTTPIITPCRCVNRCPTGFCASSYKGGISYTY